MRIFFLSLSFFLFQQCGSEVTSINRNNQDSIKSSVVINEGSDSLIGTWEAEDIGAVQTQLGYCIPSVLIFKKDNSYTWEFIKNSQLFKSKGSFMISKKETPTRIDMTEDAVTDQNDVVLQNQKIFYEGIFEIIDNNTIKIIFYNREFILRRNQFSELETQVYRKKN